LTLSETRRSILEHLNTLVTTVAVVGALSSEGAACKGYAVVDPMPAPSRCPGVASTVKGTAAWIDTPAGRRVEVLLSRPTRADASFGDPKNARPHRWVESMEATADGGLRIVIAPSPGDTLLDIYAANIRCTDASGPVEENIVFRVDLSAGDGGAAPTVGVWSNG
jgi:hypothetical protein